MSLACIRICIQVDDMMTFHRNRIYAPIDWPYHGRFNFKFNFALVVNHRALERSFDGMCKHMRTRLSGHFLMAYGTFK